MGAISSRKTAPTRSAKRSPTSCTVYALNECAAGYRIGEEQSAGVLHPSKQRWFSAADGEMQASPLPRRKPPSGTEFSNPSTTLSITDLVGRHEQLIVSHPSRRQHRQR